MTDREKAGVFLMAAGFSLIISASVGDSLIGTVAAKMLAIVAGGLYGAGFVMKVLGREG